MLKLGKYRHFKGGRYELIKIAKHSETLEDMAVYQDGEDKRKVWVRPLKMFLEKVEVAGKKVPRFKYLGK